MVTVYIWNFRTTKGGWGHSSMLVGAAMPPAAVYISWWPENLKALGFGEPKTAEMDLQLEGDPDMTIVLHGLDERAIKVWWRDWCKDCRTYFVLDRNCGSTVAKALKAGGGDQLASLGGWRADGPTPPVWTPAEVAAYARAIQRGLSVQQRAIWASA